MLEVTLDNTCIVDLEKNNSHAQHLRKLIEKHSEKKINLRVTAITASERQPNQTYVSNFNEFKDRLAVVGLGNVRVLETLCYEGLSFEGYSLQAGEKSGELERKIQEILFPKVELEYSDFCKKHSLAPNDKAWRVWANKKCDVLALWSHIWFNGDIFVTRDSHFHKKTVKPKLIEFGAGKILQPLETLALINQAL